MKRLILILLLCLSSGLVAAIGPWRSTALAATDCAAFVADLNLPDGAVVTTGQRLSKGWRLRNCGSAAWSGVRARRVGGGYGPDSFAIPATGAVGTADLWVDLTAPSSPGRQQATYQLEGPRGRFGDQFWVLLDVRAQATAGRLQVITALALSTVAPRTGEGVEFRFTVRNDGGQALRVDELAAGGRRGTDWNGEWADAPHSGGFSLQPGQTFDYRMSRTFDTPGGYFAEPVVKINGQWGGIGGANRVWFTVSSGPQPGRLQVVRALALSMTTPRAGEGVRAQFAVRNVGGRALTIEQLAAGARRGTDWNGEWADFPSVFNISLQPGQEYTYDQARSFQQGGGYFAEPVVKLNGQWGGIGGANRVGFAVQTGPEPGRLQVVRALAVSSTNPRLGEWVWAEFTVRNVGGQAMTIEQLVAGSRLGSDWGGEWADFASAFGITLQPGQEYAYRQGRRYTKPGGYFAEPVVKLGGRWGGIGGANRIGVSVQTTPEPGCLVVTRGPNLSTTTPRVGETVQARFGVRNECAVAVHLEELTSGGRRGTDWSGVWADFPHVYGLTLQPGQEYAYDQRRGFDTAGPYFTEVAVKIAGGWGGVPNYPRATFNVGGAAPANRQTWGSNVFRDQGFGDQCTAYALDRMHEATGLWMKVQGNAGRWADEARAANWSVDVAPAARSVLVMQYAGGYQYTVRDLNGRTYTTAISALGHVAWIERVDGDWVLVSDQNWARPGEIGQRWINVRGAPVAFIYADR
jgi:surface antigen